MIPTIPASAIEHAFLTYWANHLLDPRDPQNARWLEIETHQVARGRETAATLARWVALRGADVLDLGCQTGALTIAIAQAGARAVGIDVDGALVHGARLRAQCHGAPVRFEVGVAEHLPFERASFDLVACIDVIEHVRDATAMLRECVRVLRPGGVLYLQGPNRWSPRWFWRDPHYQMTGISVLPPAIGRFYVTRIRRRPRYDVGVFPVGGRVVTALRDAGCTIADAPQGWVARNLGAMFVVVARTAVSSRPGERERAADPNVDAARVRNRSVRD